MAFIQFVLSFLVSGDGTTVGQILEIKGSIDLCFYTHTTHYVLLYGLLITIIWCVTEFLPEILSTGLKEERLSIVNLILSTLRTRVSVLHFTFKIPKAYIYPIIK